MCEKCRDREGNTTRNPIDAIAVAKWLMTFESNEQVGTAQEPTACPLAQFMMTVLGFPTVAVNGDSIGWYTSDNASYLWCRAEAWQERFIRLVDNNGNGYPVDAALAMAILAEAANLDATAALEVLDFSLTTDLHATNEDALVILEVIDANH